LHRYDPKALQDAFSEAQSAKDEEAYGGGGNLGTNDATMSFVHEQELAEAEKQGLLDLVVIQRSTNSHQRQPNPQRPSGRSSNNSDDQFFFSKPIESTSNGAPSSSSTTFANNITPAKKFPPPPSSSSLGTKLTGGNDNDNGFDVDEDGDSFISEGDIMSDDDLL
jgi:hypothetical protein